LRAGVLGQGQRKILSAKGKKDLHPPHRISSPASGYKGSISLLCFFFASFSLFILPIGIDTTLRKTRLLYNDLERRTQRNYLLLTILSINVVP
jgi:hypothetical protein